VRDELRARNWFDEKAPALPLNATDEVVMVLWRNGDVFLHIWSSSALSPRRNEAPYAIDLLDAAAMIQVRNFEHTVSRLEDHLVHALDDEAYLFLRQPLGLVFEVILEWPHTDESPTWP
jgi:hypothetical protein